LGVNKLPNNYAQKIERLLSPMVGDFIAKMAIKSQCKSLGITPENIRPTHLEALSKKIGDALAFHGHQDEAGSIVKKIETMI
jgi:hypothetical protein